MRLKVEFSSNSCFNIWKHSKITFFIYQYIYIFGWYTNFSRIFGERNLLRWLPLRLTDFFNGFSHILIQNLKRNMIVCYIILLLTFSTSAAASILIHSTNTLQKNYKNIVSLLILMIIRMRIQRFIKLTCQYACKLCGAESRKNIV